MSETLAISPDTSNFPTLQNFRNIPEDLKKLDQWVIWKLEERNSKNTKIPYSAKNETIASTTNPLTWSPFKDAVLKFQLNPEKYNGIGFVFTKECNITGIDIDDAFSNENESMTYAIINECNSYTELSQSGNGIHILLYGQKQGVKARKSNLEIYDSGRYFAITGNIFMDHSEIKQKQEALNKIYTIIDPDFKKDKPLIDENKVLPVEKYTDDFIINKISNSTKAKWRTKFLKLYYEGSWQKYKSEFPSQSEADLSLCSYFAFFDAQYDQIDRLFRKSKLVRPKWIERADYRNRTIGNAISKTTIHYNPAFKTDEIITHKGYHLTEIGAAERFSKEYGENLLFCKTMNKWFIFDGARFKIDTKDKIKTYTKNMIKSMWGEIGQISDKTCRGLIIKYINSLDNHAKIENIVKLSKSEPTISIDPEELDNDPTKIIVKNGVYDLSSLTLLPFSRDYKISKQMKSDYIENAKYDKWINHLNLIFNGDKELIECFQIAIGYTFIEGNPDQVIFLSYGSGENGKSVTLDLISKIMGDYAKITNFETFAIKPNTDPHSDIAALKAVKFCVAAEAKDDPKNKFNLKLLDTELMKRLSGGEPLKCRFLYGEWFDLYPEFKLWLMLNELPTISDNSHAMWRRLILFPFNVKIPKNQKILNFDKILYDEEKAGILAWILDGYKKYKKDGLKICSAMEIAKENYHIDQDSVLKFVQEELFGKLEYIKRKECFENYKAWCAREEIDKVKGKIAFFKYITEIDGVKETIVHGENIFKIIFDDQTKFE